VTVDATVVSRAVVVAELAMLASAWWNYHEGRRTSVIEALIYVHLGVARRLIIALVVGTAYAGRGLGWAWVRLDPGYRLMEGARGLADRCASLRRPGTRRASPAKRSSDGAGGVRRLREAVAVMWRLGLWFDRLIGAGAGLVVGAVVAIVVTSIADEATQWPALGVAAMVGALVGFCVRALEAQPSAGAMASPGQLRRTMSAGAVRRSAKVTRPALDRPGRARATEYGLQLATVGGMWLYASLRDVILVVAPAQTGKTALVGNTVIDAPGAVVATSTKADIVEHTAALRHGPVMVLNPEGLAGIPSTFRWSPIEGCERPSVAIERAGYLLAGAPDSGGGNDRNFWEGMNVRLLRSLLYAAAVAGKDMRTLYGWVSKPLDEAPLRILQRHEATPPGWAHDLEQIRNPQMPKTRDSAYLTLAQAFQWMADPEMAQAVCPRPGEETFDVDRFLAERATLYLLGSERPHGSLGPLFTALTGHIHERAKWLASQRPLGRLDPPLTFVLDEAALICPVPLERWTADSGGRGIVLVIAVQSPSQLYERWGQRGGETIWNNANIKLVFGGLGVAKDLEDLSSLCGERTDTLRSRTVGSDRRRSETESERTRPLMPVNAIRQLADGHVLILRRNTAPIVGRIRPVWERPDVKRAKQTSPFTPTPLATGADNVVPLRPVRTDGEASKVNGSQPAAMVEPS
jgi:type IV secretion system protein VirD4